MKLSRRGFFSGLAALVAAPAIVRVENIMHVVPTEILTSDGISLRKLTEYSVVDQKIFVSDVINGNSLRTIDQITRDAVRLFKNSNSFMREFNRQYAEEFAFVDGKAWSQLQIRLPKDFLVADGSTLSSE